MPTPTWDADFIKAQAILAPSYNGVQIMVANAIAEERERCAKVVENMGRSNGKVRKSHKVIAAEIRANRRRIGA